MMMARATASTKCMTKVAGGHTTRSILPRSSAEPAALEDFLADFIPKIFLRVELWRIGRQEEQRDVVGHPKVAATMIGRAVENQEDILPGKPSRQGIEKALEAGCVRGRHDEIDA